MLCEKYYIFPFAISERISTLTIEHGFLKSMNSIMLSDDPSPFMKAIGSQSKIH
jgi:hypothetical protein